MSQAALVLLGAVVGVVVDRFLGPRLDAVGRSVRRWFLRRRRSRLALVGEQSMVVKYANLDSGWRPDQIRIVTTAERPEIATLVEPSPIRAAFEDVGTLEAEIDRLRTQMAGESDAQWNEEHLGPSQIDQSRDVREQYIRIVTDIRDWATHRVVRERLRRSDDTEGPAISPARLREVDRLTSTTLRIQIAVLTADGHLAIGRRGVKEGIDEPGKLCMSLESWIYAKDEVGGRVDLRNVIRRAWSEQFGVDEASVDAADLRLHTIALNVRTRNWAILGLLDLRNAGIDRERLAATRALAPPVDYWIADPLEFVPLRRRTIQDLLRSGFPDWMSESALCLLNSIGLHAPGLIPRDGARY